MGCTAVIHILGQSGITGGSLRTTQDDNCGDDDDDDVNGDEYDGCQFKDPLLLTQDDNGCDDHDIDGMNIMVVNLDPLRPTQDDNSGDDHDDDVDEDEYGQPKDPLRPTQDDNSGCCR